jgi:hypothetical protein
LCIYKLRDISSEDLIADGDDAHSCI